VEPKTTLEQPTRFGTFEVEPRAGELRKHGLKIRLQEQPFQLLLTLLERPGEVITRDELQKRIWPGTFVDFENSLNKAINKLREALGDSADTPRFIETLPRRGYRFIAPIQVTRAPSKRARRGVQWRWPLAVAGGATVALLALLFALKMTAARERPLNIQSVAVLPLENLSSDASQEYFADGITEAIIADLGRLGTLRVISRTSAMHFKKSKRLLPEIARELNVDAVVEGTVLRVGDRVRITAKLIRAAPEEQLWAESYERDLRDILTLQSEVASAIANEITTNLSPTREIRAAKFRHLVDPEAYEAYLKGRYEGANWIEGPRMKSVEYFEEAVRRDPTYAEAWAALSAAYVEVGSFGWSPVNVTRRKAREAALKALQLDDTLAEAHTTMAWLSHGEWDWAAARKQLQRAIALDPNNSRAHQSYGYHLAIMGQFDQAVAEMNRALMLDPFSGNKHNSFGAALYWAGRYDEALGQMRQTPDPDVNSGVRHRRMADIYERKGMQKEAVVEFATSLRLRGQAASAALVEKEYLSSGFAKAKESFLREDIKDAESKQRYVQIACDYASLGENDKAFEWLEVAVRGRDNFVIFIKEYEQLKPLHFDPRYLDVVRRLGLPS
jgi:TolB-like protein/DNA-binding winged helix-turn-helix (wHTH) protein/Tfp pilus assembly protein PilF